MVKLRTNDFMNILKDAVEKRESEHADEIKALELKISRLEGELSAYKSLNGIGFTLPQTVPSQPLCDPDYTINRGIVQCDDSTTSGTTENTPITTSATKITSNELCTFTEGATTGRNEQTLA